MDKIKRFFECLIPETVCNLNCEYCYIVQRKQNTQKVPQLDYPPEVIGKALTQERLGGVCYFSICGAGETFVPDYLMDILFQLLKNGHYVNVTTNGTLTNKIRRLADIPAPWRERLHIAFSFHYLELKKKNLLETFFSNVQFVKELGCSFLVQLNLYDGYIPYLDEIRQICMEKIHALPQIAATRRETSLTQKIDLMTELTEEEYLALGKSFHSPLFDFTMENFNRKRTEFCYAGSWAYTLNLKTGILKRCYASCIHQNIFEDTETPIINLPVGKHCGSLFCMNSSHFLSLGVIPELKTPTYAQLRDRESASWYSEGMREFLSGKLEENNACVQPGEALLSYCAGTADKLLYKSYQTIKKLKRKTE